MSKEATVFGVERVALRIDKDEALASLLRIREASAGLDRCNDPEQLREALARVNRLAKRVLRRAAMSMEDADE